MSARRFADRMPRRAVVLAAGLGTRMRPFSLDLPKPLMPLWNRPLILRTLETLRDWGVRDVLVNLHQGADEIFRVLRDGPVSGLALDFSFEPVVLGTGGALRRAAWFIEDDPFWMVNSDIAFEADPAPLIRALADDRAVAALWMHPAQGPRTVELEGDRILNFRSSRPGAAGTCTFCGLQVIRPEILRYLPEAERPFSIVEAYERAMRAGRRIAGVCLPRTYWADLGTRDRILAAHGETAAAAKTGAPGGRLARESHQHLRRLRRAGITVRGWAAVDPQARIEPGATLENAVIWSGARAGPLAQVRHAMVGRNTIVRGSVSDAILPFSVIASPGEAAALRAAGLCPEKTTARGFEVRGSAREFIRVEDGHRRAMLIRYGTERMENGRYAGHSRFLGAQGLPVPRILHEAPAERFLLMEDLGERTLQTAWPELSETRRAQHLVRVARWVDRFHAAAAAARRRRIGMEPPMDAGLYAWERDLFLERYVAEWAGRPDAVAALRKELEPIALRLKAEPSALIHRDLQSSNLLLTPRGPVFIDYQGMRMGPALYDWASFLYDPYLEMTAAFRCRMIRRILTPLGVSDRRLASAAVQRLTQALGAYARLSARPGGEGFAAVVPRALANYEEALQAAEFPHPALSEFIRSERNRLAKGSP